VAIRVYNNLPPHIKEESHNPKQYQTCLKHFLYIHYFYPIEEYSQYKPA
jgi:hypothetical protein